MSSSPVILAALRDEVRYLRRPVHVTGMGASRLIAAIERLQPRHIVLIGFAGGLDPQRRTGDVLHVRQVRREGDAPIDLPRGQATLLTVEEPACTVEIKRRLRQRTHADAVDMETYPIARFCRDRGVMLDVVRAITDPAEASLPPQSVHWVKSDGSRDPAAAIGYLLTHPHRAGMLIRLAAASRRAARALADTLRTWPDP